MTASSSTSAVFYSKFCLSWRKEGKTHSVWTGNIEKLLKIFFSITSEYKRVEITYFPEAEKDIKLFRRIKK